MPNQIVPDGAILSMSPAGLLASLSVMFSVTGEDLLDHPQFREMATINPVVYPDYIRHALVTSLHEQGVQFSPTMMKWLQSLSITACRAYNVATLWGNNPEYVRAQDRCIALALLPSIKAAGFHLERISTVQVRVLARCSCSVTARAPRYRGRSTGSSN